MNAIAAAARRGARRAPAPDLTGRVPVLASAASSQCLLRELMHAFVAGPAGNDVVDGGEDAAVDVDEDQAAEVAR